MRPHLSEQEKRGSRAGLGGEHPNSGSQSGQLSVGRHRAPGRLLSPEPTRLSATHVHAGPAESSRSETEHPGVSRTPARAGTRWAAASRV